MNRFYICSYYRGTCGSVDRSSGFTSPGDGAVVRPRSRLPCCYRSKWILLYSTACYIFPFVFSPRYIAPVFFSPQLLLGFVTANFIKTYRDSRKRGSDGYFVSTTGETRFPVHPHNLLQPMTDRGLRDTLKVENTRMWGARKFCKFVRPGGK